MPAPETFSKLDNPVWYSLVEGHPQWAINYGTVQFYHPDYCPFGGFEINSNIAQYIDEYANLTGNFFIVGNQPELPNLLTLHKDVVCLQMVLQKMINTTITEEVKLLTHDDTEAIYDLVTLVQPGYFKRKTTLMGAYFGIYKNGELVAITGERMQMNDFVEVSAVVTRPNYTGKGYAKQLVAHTANNIISRGKIPFLHVAEENTGAIGLYKQLGLETRRKISFWNIIKK